MPDARLQKARATLPEGYQFGDAKPPRPRRRPEPFITMHWQIKQRLKELDSALLYAKLLNRPDDGRRW